MERFLPDKRFIFAVLTIFVFVFAIQLAEPTSAASYKKFSSGSKVFYSTSFKEYYKYTWKSYKKTNRILVKDFTVWQTEPNKKYYGSYLLKKVSKTKLKIVDTYTGHTTVYYKKTRLSAYQYYKKHFNKNGKAGFGSVI